MKISTTTSSNNIPSGDDKDSFTESRGVSSGKDGLWEGLGQLVNTSMPRLFLILSFVIYGIVAFSKGKEGVNNIDISILLFFNIFVFIIFGLLILSRDLYRAKIIQELVIFGLSVKLKKKVRILVLIFLVVIVSLFLFRNYLILFLSKFINYV